MSTPDLSGLSQPGNGMVPNQPNPGAGGQAPQQAPPGPHAGLMAMIKGLALGVDSFARAAATHGREGGVGEVQQAQANDQAMQQSAQRAQREQQEGDLRMKTMNAQLLMQQAAYHHALQMYPTEEKEANLKVLNDATASYKDALSEGYDIADPTQAAMWRGMQQNIINIPFSTGQNQQEVLSTAKDAATKDGKDLTDYVPLASYNDGKHGSGGNLTLVPMADLQKVQATPRQISTGMAQMKATLTTATAALGADDPDVRALGGKIGLIQSTLDKGGKPSAYDFIQLNSSTLGPMATRIAGVTQASKIAQGKAEASKAQSDATTAAQNADPNFVVAQAGKKAGAEAQATLPFVGQKAAAEAAARQPYEVALKQMEAPIAAGVANDKEAREKVDTYAKAYVDKLQGSQELISSLDQAASGNAAASKAALAKMVGLTMPPGAKRLSPEMMHQIQTQGNIPQRYIGAIEEALTGDKWTTQMTQDMRDFAQAQTDVAAEALRGNVRVLNVNHKTNVDPEALINAAGHLQSQPSGPQAKKWGTMINQLSNSVQP